MKKIVCLFLMSILPSMAFSDTGSVSVSNLSPEALSVEIGGLAAAKIWNELAIPSVPVTSGETGSKVLYMAKVGKSIQCGSSDDKGNAPYTCFFILNSRSGSIQRF